MFTLPLPCYPPNLDRFFLRYAAKAQAMNPDTGVADGFAISTAPGQWSERFTYQSEPAFIVGGVAVEMLVYDMLDEVADAVAGTAEESGDAFHAVKRVVADCNLMLVVLAELNQREVCLSVIFEVALALLGGGTG